MAVKALFNIKHLHLDIPYTNKCIRKVVVNSLFDPGIGEMVVNPTSSPAFWRVRPYSSAIDNRIFDNTFDLTFN